MNEKLSQSAEVLRLKSELEAARLKARYYRAKLVKIRGICSPRARLNAEASIYMISNHALKKEW